MLNSNIFGAVFEILTENPSQLTLSLFIKKENNAAEKHVCFRISKNNHTENNFSKKRAK